VTGGFEFELARLLAHRFGLMSVRVKIERFHRVVRGGLDGADLAIDLITPTSRRERWLAFSTPYLDAAPTVLVRNGVTVPDLDTARNLRWGAVQATTFVGMIRIMISPRHRLRLYEDNSALIRALKAGQVQAVLLDLPLAVLTASRSDGMLDAVAQLPNPEPLAIALPKGSNNLQAVDSAIEAFTTDGTIDHLLSVWVGSVAANAQKSLPVLETTL
jgi:polar amino acid transport system substrate-binding protein